MKDWMHIGETLLFYLRLGSSAQSGGYPGHPLVEVYAQEENCSYVPDYQLWTEREEYRRRDVPFRH